MKVTTILLAFAAASFTTVMAAPAPEPGTKVVVVKKVSSSPAKKTVVVKKKPASTKKTVVVKKKPAASTKKTVVVKKPASSSGGKKVVVVKKPASSSGGKVKHPQSNIPLLNAQISPKTPFHRRPQSSRNPPHKLPTDPAPGNPPPSPSTTKPAKPSTNNTATTCPTSSGPPPSPTALVPALRRTPTPTLWRIVRGLEKIFGKRAGRKIMFLLLRGLCIVGLTRRRVVSVAHLALFPRRRPDGLVRLTGTPFP